MAGEPQLRQGSTDDDSGGYVTYLQQYLTNTGHYQGAIDGIFGPLTDAAVQQFQSEKGLVVDGIVGPMTWGTLNGDLAWENFPALSRLVQAYNSGGGDPAGTGDAVLAMLDVDPAGLEDDDGGTAYA
jgi:peptidoglycan hydrolase-like protein with peptidoglycan-binding domain